MNELRDFIESGILELYVLGDVSAQESAEVEQMAAKYSEVRDEINAISLAMENYARQHAVEPDPNLKPFIWATINYMDRLKNGEAPSFPPMLHMGSSVSDYSEWLNRLDMQLTDPLEDAEARIIGYTPQATTAIVWLKEGAPAETHTNELEKFLIVEGTCDITIGNDVHHMKKGDVLIIPLHMPHHVRVTSLDPCKIILQRVAA